MSGKTYSLYSWNVNGIRAGIKKGFWEWLQKEQPDVIGLQETKISADQLTKDMLEQEGYHSYWSHAEKRGYSGEAIFTKEEHHSVSEGLSVAEFDRQGRLLVDENPEFVYYTIYYPNGQRDDERLDYKMRFYDAFLEHAEAKRKEGKKLIVCGDVNTAHKPIDLARPKANEKISGFLPIERAWMDKLVDHGYVDTFREFCDEPDQYSWWNMRSAARERNVGWRIDYFFVTEDLKANLKGADIHQDVMGSDHCPVSVKMEF